MSLKSKPKFSGRLACPIERTNSLALGLEAHGKSEKDAAEVFKKENDRIPTTVILFEPSVGLPTSANGPHPRREGFDDVRLRTMGHRDEIKPVAGQSERVRLHELPAP